MKLNDPISYSLTVTMISRITLNIRKAWYIDTMETMRQTQTIVFNTGTTLNFASREDGNQSIPLSAQHPGRGSQQRNTFEDNGSQSTHLTDQGTSESRNLIKEA